MGRHRRPQTEPTDTRLPDGDVVPIPGHRRWVDQLPTRELPLVNPAPRVELVRPYVTSQERRRWLSRWSR